MRVGFVGKAGSGKTTTSTFLVEQYGFVCMSFAAALKDVATVFYNMQLKDRMLLQKLGDAMRSVNPDVFVNIVLDEIAQSAIENVVIDDVRYLNEAVALKKNGFVLIRLVGRGYNLPPEQAQHPSEKEQEQIETDYELNTLNADWTEVLADIIVKHKWQELTMSARYFDKMSEKVNRNYERGRAFEYRVMADLRRRGFHTMRRFGSHGEVVDGIGHVPIDLTAYRAGIYLMVTCKYSILHPTTTLDDPLRMNLRAYAAQFSAIPLFAGIDRKRHVYYVDLRDDTVFDLDAKCVEFFGTKYQDKVQKGPDKDDMKQLLTHGWETIAMLFEEYRNAKDDPKLRVRWAGEIVKMINVMIRLLWRAGATGTEDELSGLMGKLDEYEKRKKEDEPKSKDEANG